MSVINLLPVLSVALFAVLLVLLELGSRLAIARGDTESSRLGPIEGAVFGLLGLLIAFAFSGAAMRYNDRRELIIQEADAIGTVYMRLDLVDPALRPAVVQQLRDYTDTRLELYRHLGEPAMAAQLSLRAGFLQQSLWRTVLADCNDQKGLTATFLLVPALNEMFDVSAKRTAALRNHPPSVVYVLLISITLACAFLAGYAFGPGQAKHRIAMISFSAIMSFSIYVIIDLEFPRFGLIRISGEDVVLEQVRDTMH